MDTDQPRTPDGDGATAPRRRLDVLGLSRRRSGRNQSERPTKPIRYGPLARLSDWRNAALDANAALPRVEDDDRATTQTVVVLERLARDAAATERKAYEADRVTWTASLARKRAELPFARREIDAAREQLKEISQPLSEREATERFPGDENIPESLVRQRRRCEHQLRIAAARSALARTEKRLAALRIDLAELVERLQSRRGIARATVERVHAHVRRRRAAYWRRLVRKHPDGERLNARLEPDWPLFPDWLNEPLDVTSFDVEADLADDAEDQSS